MTEPHGSDKSSRSEESHAFPIYLNVEVEANIFLGQKTGPPIGLEAHTMGIKGHIDIHGYMLTIQAFLPIFDILLGSVSTTVSYTLALG